MTKFKNLRVAKYMKPAVTKFQTGGPVNSGYAMKPNESVVTKTLEMERAGIPLTQAGLAKTQEHLKGTSLEGIQMSAANKLFRDSSNMPGRPAFNSMNYRGIFTPVEGSEKVYVDPRYRNSKNTLDMIRQNNPGRNIEFIFGRAPAARTHVPQYASTPQQKEQQIASAYRLGGAIKKVADIANKPAYEAPGHATNAINAKQAAIAFGTGGRFYFNGQLF